MSRTTLSVLLVMLLGVCTARAENKAPPPDGDRPGKGPGMAARGAHPCRADAEKLCPGIEPGHGAMKCLAEHKDQLSAACKEKMERRQTHGANHPCKADGEKLCPGMQRGPGLGRCLHENKDKLSEACKAKMAEHRMGKEPRPDKGAPEPK